MKILLNQSEYSEKFVCLTNALYKCVGLSIGSANGEIDDQTIIGFKPDLVIHNNPNLLNRLYNKNIIQIFCHHSTPITELPSIDLDQLGPCIDVSLFDNVQVKDRYKCDIVFFGDIGVFDQELLIYADGKYSLRVFNPKPINIPFYCGVLPRQEHPSAYLSAKTCPFSIREDKSRLYEIVKSGGTPIVYDPSNKNDFHLKLRQVLSGNKLDNPITDIEISQAGNIHKLGSILKSIGFSRLGESVLRGKL